MNPLGGAALGRAASLLLLPGIVALFPSFASGQEATYTGGIQYAGGHYVFEERSEAVYVTNGLRLRFDALEIGLSVPVAIQNGGLVTLVGGVPIPTGGNQSGIVGRRKGGRRIGSAASAITIGPAVSIAQDADTTVVFDPDFKVHIADPTLNVAAELFSGFGALRSVRVDGRASIPINDLDSGVGTGEWDFALGASTVLGAGSTLLFVDGSYWWFGDLPELELKDGLSYGLGVGFPLKEGRASALLTFSGMTETISTVDPPMSLGASVGWSVGDRGFMNVGAGAGLTESSADFFAQVGWSLRLNGGRNDDQQRLTTGHMLPWMG